MGDHPLNFVTLWN